MYKTFTSFVNLLINKVFLLLLFYILKIHQQNITEMTKKDYKKKGKERYQNIFKEKEEEKKQRYVRERYKILSKDEKQNMLEYSNKFYKIEKKKFSIMIIKKYFHSKNGFFQVCIRNFFLVRKSVFCES